MTSRKRGVKHRGGIGNYSKAKNDIMAWTKNDQNREAHFTTMFDLFRLPHDFPDYEDAKRASDPYQCVQTLEDALRDDIDHPRFVPYIQLHEFEALLLCDPQKLDAQFPDHGTEIGKLAKEVSTFDSPERINDGCQTAPSKRIINAIPADEGMKVSAGPLVAEKIGLVALRSKCRHFDEWLSELEALA